MKRTASRKRALSRAAAKTPPRPSPERDALVALLELWTRVGGNAAKTDADLVRAIEIAGERAAYGLALGGKVDWLAAAKRGDPVERGLLLATVEECERDELIKRWTAISAFDDPRVSGKLAERPAPVRVKPMLDRFLGLLFAAARDRRTLESIKRIQQQRVYDAGKKEMIARTGERIRVAHRAIVKASKKPTAEERALIASTIAADGGAREKTAEQESELLAAIYAAPLDNGPREIYADWLLERSDPRGEFITLQLGTSPTPDERKRAAELEKAHARDWLGPLYKLPIEIDFDRGFPHRFAWHEDLDLPDDPRWSTCESAERMPPPSGQRALQRLMRATSECLARLGELPPDSVLEQLCWHYPKPGKARTAAIAAYRKAKLPALIYVDFKAEYDDSWAPSKIGWVFEGRALQTVDVPGDSRRLPAYVEMFANHDPTLESLRIGSKHGFTWITREDGKLHLLVYAGDAAALEAALAGLELLPPNLLGSVDVSTQSKAARTRDRFVAVLARHAGCTLEFRT